MSDVAASPASPPAGGEELIFAAPERPAGSRRALGTLLGVSLVGHALGFYALQTFYAPAGTLPPAAPPARWTLVPAGTPEAAALARWLALADPALGAGALPPRPERVLARLPSVPYVPSFQARPAATGWLETLGDVPAVGGLPAGSAFPPAPVLPPRSPVVATAPSPAPTAARARVVLPEPLRRRLPTGEEAPKPDLPALPTVASLAELPRPATFLVGVRPEGGPPLVFREVASGITAADEAARAHLESLPFLPAEAGAQGTTWGRVTVWWGR